MKSQLVRADFCSTGTGLPKLTQRPRTASFGEASSPWHTPGPLLPPSPHPLSPVEGGGRSTPSPSQSLPPATARSAPPPLSPGAHPRPVGAALGTHSLGPAASPAPQPGASAALPSLIKEGGSGALNLCLPLQGGCNSTPPIPLPGPDTPPHPPTPPAHSHTHFLKKLKLGCQVGCLGDFGKVPGRGCVPIFSLKGFLV